ncbi:PREDICTED: uncharacterized protein LOC109116474 [Tarenaya hassleriana]|uniref:uncharacterized protein LOC109116474 n=1 Tax=Tarenaya hassleriana TaxID=28532 RepID=UPI0008FD40DC|nr:PREDICTED: uncharacterized protein LOC109116474 [Tarenaya hassleriana]
MDGGRATWADQWDNSGSGHGGGAVTKSGGAPSSNTAKYKEKLGQGFEKTKAVASSGFRKIKHGSSLGLRWVKDKYRKTTQKH